jgi:hypothetical protein
MVKIPLLCTASEESGAVSADRLALSPGPGRGPLQAASPLPADLPGHAALDREAKLVEDAERSGCKSLSHSQTTNIYRELDESGGFPPGEIVDCRVQGGALVETGRRSNTSSGWVVAISEVSDLARSGAASWAMSWKAKVLQRASRVGCRQRPHLQPELAPNRFGESCPVPHRWKSAVWFPPGELMRCAGGETYVPCRPFWPSVSETVPSSEQRMGRLPRFCRRG